MFLEEVDRARRMTPANRLLEGLRLQDRAFALAMDGLRHRFPVESDEQLVERLHEHFDRLGWNGWKVRVAVENRRRGQRSNRRGLDA